MVILLRLAFADLGKRSNFVGFSVAAVMEQAHGSTMGYCLDDVKDDKILEEIIIGTYSQVVTTDVN